MRAKHLLPALALAALAALVSGCMQATSPATGRTFSTSMNEQQEAALGAKEHPKIIAEFGQSDRRPAAAGGTITPHGDSGMYHGNTDPAPQVGPAIIR